MSKLFFIFVLFSVLFISCKSTPDRVQEPVQVKTEETGNAQMPETPAKAEKPDESKTVIEEDEVVAEFDGVTITKKDKEQAVSEIIEVVKKLNEITEKRDYSGWEAFLSESYKQEFSKPSVLKKTSENLPGAARGIKLKDLNDYFRYVFVPSRQQGRVDDIQYLSPIRIRVLKKEKLKELIFYDLEKINGKWKLVPTGV